MRMQWNEDESRIYEGWVSIYVLMWLFLPNLIPISCCARLNMFSLLIIDSLLITMKNFKLNTISTKGRGLSSGLKILIGPASSLGRVKITRASIDWRLTAAQSKNCSQPTSWCRSRPSLSLLSWKLTIIPTSLSYLYFLAMLITFWFV